MQRKLNDYDLSGEYGIGYTRKGQPFYFDLEDYDKIKDYCWYICSKGYVRGYTTDNKQILMHRLIMNCTDRDSQVDHKNGSETRNDNRKSNLRIVTNQQNQMNTDIRKDNTTGAKGISWHKGKNKWIAQIGYNNKIIYLGVYDEFEDAVRVRKEAEQRYFGEWSCDNSRQQIEQR